MHQNRRVCIHRDMYPALKWKHEPRTHFKSHKALAMNLLWTKKNPVCDALKKFFVRSTHFFRTITNLQLQFKCFCLEKKLQPFLWRLRQFVWYSFFFIITDYPSRKGCLRRLHYTLGTMFSLFGMFWQLSQWQNFTKLYFLYFLSHFFN